MISEAISSRKLHDRALRGIFWMVSGVALYALSDALIKYLVGVYPVPQVISLRAASRLIPLALFALIQGGYKAVFATGHPSRHAFRLVVSLSYTCCFMYAFSLASLTTVYTLSYTSCFFMILLSALFLKESVPLGKWIAIGIGLIGVVVAMRPNFDIFETAGLIVLAGSFLASLNKILMRRLAATEHSLAITIYPNLAMLLVTLPYLFWTSSWESLSWQDTCLFGIIGILAASAQYAMAQSVRFAEGSALAPIDYTNLIWAMTLDFLCWGTSPDAYTLMGAGLIVGSNLYVFFKSSRTTSTAS